MLNKKSKGYVLAEGGVDRYNYMLASSSSTVDLSQSTVSVRLGWVEKSRGESNTWSEASDGVHYRAREFWFHSNISDWKSEWRG